MAAQPSTTSQATAEDARTPPISWWALFVLFVCYVLSLIDRNLLGIMVDDVKADLAINDTQFSLLVGGPFALFYALCGLPIGHYVDKYPRRWFVTGGVVFWSAMVGLSGLASTFSALLLARLGVGAGEAALSPAAYSMLPDMFSRRRITLATALFALGGAVGAALSLWLGGYLLDEFKHGALVGFVERTGLAPWQLVFVTFGLVGLPVTLLTLTLREPRRRESPLQQSSGSEPLLTYLWRRRLLHGPTIIGFGAAAMVSYSLLHWAPAHLMRHFGLSASDAGLAMGATLLVCAATAQPLIGWFVDRQVRQGARTFHYDAYLVIAVICTAAVLVAFRTDTLLIFLGAFAVMACIQIPSALLGFASVQLTSDPRYVGRVSALLLLAMTAFGMGLGPLLVGIATDYIFRDPQQVGASITLVCLLGFGFASISLLIGRGAFGRAMAAAHTSNGKVP